MAVPMFGKGIPIGRKRGPAGSIYFDTQGGPMWVRVEDPVGTLRWRPVLHGGLAGLSEDFLLDAGATLPKPWGTQDTSAAGSPTLDYVADADGGEYVLALATNNEAEAITLHFVDQLVFDVTKRPVMGGRLKITSDQTGAGGAFAAGDKFVFGLASARNATLDNVTTNAWLMAAGANHNIYFEADDGTTDTDDQDTGVDYAESTYFDFAIEIDGDLKASFFVADAKVGQASIAAATGNLQVFLELTKAAAANKDHKVTVDHIYAFSRR